MNIYVFSTFRNFWMELTLQTDPFVEALLKLSPAAVEDAMPSFRPCEGASKRTQMMGDDLVVFRHGICICICICLCLCICICICICKCRWICICICIYIYIYIHTHLWRQDIYTYGHLCLKANHGWLSTMKSVEMRWWGHPITLMVDDHFDHSGMNERVIWV